MQNAAYYQGGKGRGFHIKNIFFILYILFGVYLAFEDTDALVLYVTILPVQFLFVLWAYRTRNLYLYLFMLLMFISQGINPPFFFLNKAERTSTGFGAIGNFDFSIGGYFSAYSYVFVFCLSLLFVNGILSLFQREKKDYIVPWIVDYTRKWTENAKVRGKYLTYIVLFSVLMIFVSIWMYSNQIGLIGLSQKSLPFHLSGILFYFRRYVASAILVFFYIKCRQKKTALFVIFIYSLLVGLTGTSRSVAAMCLIPIAAYCFVIKKYWQGTVSLLLYVICFLAVTTARNLVFSYDYIVFTPIEVIEFAFVNMFSSGENVIISFISDFSSRLYGGQITVLMNQQYMATFEDLIKYYITGSHRFDMMSIFGVIVDASRDYAVGVGVGYTGLMILMSNHNYILVFIQAVIMSILFVVMNNNVQRLISTNTRPVIKIIGVGVYAGSMLFLWDGHLMLFYMCLLSLYLFRIVFNYYNIKL